MTIDIFNGNSNISSMFYIEMNVENPILLFVHCQWYNYFTFGTKNINNALTFCVITSLFMLQLYLTAIF